MIFVNHCLFLFTYYTPSQLSVVQPYLYKDDHIPYCFDKYDVRATLPQLLVFWEADLKQISCVLQLLHFHLHRSYASITLQAILICYLNFLNHTLCTTFERSTVKISPLTDTKRNVPPAHLINKLIWLLHTDFKD